jgi:hypothetical protein
MSTQIATEAAPKVAPNRQLVTRTEAAQHFLPGSESSYVRWEKKGLLKPVRLNGPTSRKLYRIADLEALAARGAV